jgi:MFS family permease
VAIALVAVFLVRQARIEKPLMPLRLFHSRNVSGANIVMALLVVGMFGIFFLGALYMQLVLRYSPLEVGLAYAPSTVLWGATSLFLSDRLVMRFGIRPPLVAGLGLMAAALVLFARMPVDGSFAVDILPATMVLALGAGIAFNPLLLAAMSGVEQTETGLASGVANTAFMMGGALGLAVLASVAASRTSSLDASETHVAALTGGYHLAFLVGAIFAAIAATLGGLLLPSTAPGAAAHAPPEPEPAA